MQPLKIGCFKKEIEFNMLLENQIQFIQRDHVKLAYHHQEGTARGPGVVFLPGYRSDMSGTKALYLKEFCETHSIQYTRFDYSGHGQSSEKFEDVTLADWLKDSLHILDQVTRGPQILVGSSMGGWIMLLLALMRPERIFGCIGIAAAPDFTKTFVEDELSPDQLKQLKEQGEYIYPLPPGAPEGERPFKITLKMVEQGANYLLLQEGAQPHGLDLKNFTKPLHLLHGMNDVDVPWQTSIKILEKISSSEARLSLIKGGDHRLSTFENLELLTKSIQEMLDLERESR